MGGGEEILGVGCRKDWNGLRIRGVGENDGKGKNHHAGSVHGSRPRAH